MIVANCGSDALDQPIGVDDNDVARYDAAAIEMYMCQDRIGFAVGDTNQSRREHRPMKPTIAALVLCPWMWLCGNFAVVAADEPSANELIKRASTVRGMSSIGTENWNKMVIRRVFPGLRGRNQAVLPCFRPELDV